MMTYCKVKADIDRYTEEQDQCVQFEQKLESALKKQVDAADAQLETGQDITYRQVSIHYHQLPEPDGS